MGEGRRVSAGGGQSQRGGGSILGSRGTSWYPGSGAGPPGVHAPVGVEGDGHVIPEPLGSGPAEHPVPPVISCVESVCKVCGCLIYSVFTPPGHANAFRAWVLLPAPRSGELHSGRWSLSHRDLGV